MGSLATKLFSESRKSKKDTKVTTPVLYPTGIMPLDYINGQRVKVFKDDELIEEYDSVGFVGGTMIMFTADPGLGKTTLAQQAAVTIASMFADSMIVHEDIEHSSHINRIYNITRKNPKWIKDHYIIYQDGHTEDITDRFLDHAKAKLNNRKEFEYDTGLKDIYGDPIMGLIPTVCIIDSITVMRSKNSSILEDDKNISGIEDCTNNMAAARTAKFNSEVFKQIIPWAKKANIMILLINQINNRIQTGFVPQARDLVGLGDNEVLGGGRAIKYLANNTIRLKNKATLKPDKEYHINGHIISASFLKSRTNASNVDVELIFDKQNGFSATLTLLHFAINNNIVKKQGQKYVIPGYEDEPFTKYNFCEVACKHPMLMGRLYQLCLPKLQEYLDIFDEDAGSEALGDDTTPDFETETDDEFWDV